MIKMFIDNEEVVSDREFAINEEMLSASSTILNNCYPKSWELTKDYVSNFYYPKDYSKFLLGEGEFEKGNTEYSVLEATCKNLLKTSYYNITNYVSQLLTLKVGTYTVNYEGDNSNGIYIRKADGTTPINGTSVAEGYNRHQMTFTLTENGNYYIQFYRSGGFTSFDKAQLEIGTEATSYEEYGGGFSYNTNIEKVWDNFILYGNTYQETRSGKNLLKLKNTIDRGITTVINNDGSISINGTATDTLAYIDTGENIPLTSGTYTLSLETATLVNLRLFLYNGGTQVTAMTISSGNKSITTTINQNITSYSAIIYGLTSGNNYNLTLKLMLESGSQATPFEPYGIMPSPDFPSELVSVGYENLFDKDNINVFYGYVSASNVITSSSGSFSIYVPCEPNTTYTIQKNGGTVFSLAYCNQEPANNGTAYGRVLNNTATSLTITTGNEAKYLISLICATNASDRQEIIDSVQIQKGSTTHSYIPYGKYGIEVKTIGKNLFDKTTIIDNMGILYANGNLGNNNNQQASDYIIVEENTEYYCNYTTYTSNYYGMVFYDENKDYISGNSLANIKRKFTTPIGTHYIRFSLSKSSGYTTDLDTLQLEKGTQATTYEEYKSNTYLYTLDNPLRSIGNTKDLLYIKNGMLYVDRKIGSKIYNGTETEWTFSNGSAYPFRINIPDAEKLTQTQAVAPNVMVNYYTPFYWNISNRPDYGVTSSTNTILAFRNIDITSLADFKTWLSTHNTEVLYVRETPNYEALGYLGIPSSYEGDNNVVLETGLRTQLEAYYYWKNFNVLFAGIVKNSGDISLNPRYPHYCSLQILDYKTFLSESNTLDFVIANKTVEEAINMVVNAVKNYGFIVGNINISGADDIIGAYSTLNKSAYDVLQYLANISGSRWRARYVDSSTMAIDFYDPDTLPQASDIEYTKEYWENNNIVDMTFNYGTRDYRNKQILLSDEVYANINYDETLISNGYSSTFTVQNNIGLVVSVIVNNEEKTVGTNNDKQMGIDADFYYTPGKNIIESNMIYPASTLIHLTYQPLVKGRQIVYNNSEVDRISRQTDTEGVIARYETRNDILSSDELEKIAQTYIEYKGKAEIILTLKTQNKDLYNIGEVVYFNAPIDELKQNYMVKTKQIEYVVINDIINLFYIYEMTSSFNSEKAINYFDNQRNKASGNIADGESITRNIDIETGVGIIWTEGSVSSASVTVTGDNLLNSALNSPFVE